MSITNKLLHEKIYQFMKNWEDKKMVIEKKEQQESVVLPGNITYDTIEEELPEDREEDEEQEFYYLENEELRMEYDAMDNNHKYNMCVYRINTELSIPFLQFALELKDGVYKFPSFDVPIEPSIVGLAEEPVEELVEEHVEEPVEEHVEEPVEEPVEELVEEPVEEPIEPVEELVEEHVEEPIEPAEELVEEPVVEPTPLPAVTEPIAPQIVTEPTLLPAVTEPTPLPAVTEPIAPQIVTEPTPLPAVTEPIAPQIVTEPTPLPAVTEPIAPQIVTEPTTTPIIVPEPAIIPQQTIPIENKNYRGGYEDEEEEPLYKNAVDTFHRFIGQSNDIKIAYKGFAENNINGQTYITTVFNDDIQNIDETPKTWVTIDEIMNKHNCLGTPIDETVSKIFGENRFLRYLVYSNEQAVPTPATFYMCKENDNGEPENVYYSEGENSQISVSLLDHTIDHKIFGSIYLFSAEPINTTNFSKIKRYSLFINDTLYILNKDEDLSEFIPSIEVDEEESRKKIYTDYECIRFYQSSDTYWAVKYNKSFVEI